MQEIFRFLSEEPVSISMHSSIISKYQKLHTIQRFVKNSIKNYKIFEPIISTKNSAPSIHSPLSIFILIIPDISYARWKYFSVQEYPNTKKRAQIFPSLPFFSHPTMETVKNSIPISIPVYKICSIRDGFKKCKIFSVNDTFPPISDSKLLDIRKLYRFSIKK